MDVRSVSRERIGHHDEPPIAAVQPNNGIRSTSPRPEQSRPIRAAIYCCSISGERVAARQRLLRHHVDRLPGERVPEAYAKIFESCERREIRRSNSEGVRRGGRDNPRMGSDRIAREMDSQSGLRKAFRSPHRAQHRPGSAWQRREHGQARNAGRSQDRPGDMLLDRAGNLSARVWDSQRSGCLRGRARSARDRRNSERDFATAGLRDCDRNTSKRGWARRTCSDRNSGEAALHCAFRRVSGVDRTGNGSPAAGTAGTRADAIS